MPNDQKDMDAYLARIRKTIADSENLVAQAELRIAETDRMLERQGLTREQVMAMRFSDAQMEAVNAELKRRGLDPLERWERGEERVTSDEIRVTSDEIRVTSDEIRVTSDEIRDTGDGRRKTMDVELENRQRKFGMMMKPFQI